MTILYKKLELEDCYKRHLIVGDIHGQYALLQKLLKDIDYDAESDMLYTVGDMIDRGEESYEVVDFFTSHKNRVSILGNHEMMVIRGQTDLWVMNCRSSTHLYLIENLVDKSWLQSKIEDLPIFLDVSCGDLNFRLVHAETNQTYDNEDIMMRLNGGIKDYRFEEEAIWGRSTIYLYGNDPDYVDIKDKTNTFVGHSIVPKVLNINSRTYLNVPMGRLAIIDVKTNDIFDSMDFK